MKKLIIVLSIFLGVWLGIQYLFPLIFPFLLGSVLALAAEPLAKLLCTRLHMPRPAAAGIAVSAAFCFLGAALLLLAALIIRELGNLAGVLPDLEQTARKGMDLLSSWLLGLAARLPEGIGGILKRNITGLFSGSSAVLEEAMRYVLGLASGILSHVPGSALTLGTGVISSFMISAKLPKIREWIRKTIPRERIDPVLRGMKRIRRTLVSWLLAQAKLSGVTWVLVSVGFLILGIRHGPLWALLVALVDAFPVLGTGTVLIPWALVSFLQGDGAMAIGLAGIYVTVAVVRSVLEPKLLGKQLGLDPLVTLIALYVGFRLWGLGGMILAPMLAVTTAQLIRQPEKTE